MSVEQVARDFILNMKDVQKTRSYLTSDAMVDGGVLPRAMQADEAIQVINSLLSAFPDLKFDIKDVSVNGNQATVRTQWSGTNTGRVDLPIPGMVGIPPTGRKVSVPDTYIITVLGDKVSHMTVDSPSNGGIPGALHQLGVDMPET